MRTFIDVSTKENTTARISLSGVFVCESENEIDCGRLTEYTGDDEDAR